MDLTEAKEILESMLRMGEERYRANSIIVDALKDQMKAFEDRTGHHNTYAVRMAVDHKSYMRRDAKENEALRIALHFIEEYLQTPSSMIDSFLKLSSNGESNDDRRTN